MLVRMISNIELNNNQVTTSSFEYDQKEAQTIDETIANMIERADIELKKQ